MLPVAATPAHVVSEFQRRARVATCGPCYWQDPHPGAGSGPVTEEVLGDFRGAAKLFPNGRLAVFPGVTGFVQHLLPVPCAWAWLDFAASLQQ